MELGGYTSANRSVPPDAYADPVARSIADQLTHAEVTRFGAGDLMPAEVQRAWWAGMLELVEDPTTLDALLTSQTQLAAARGDSAGRQRHAALISASVPVCETRPVSKWLCACGTTMRSSGDIPNETELLVISDQNFGAFSARSTRKTCTAR